jgi:hypothetical protein
MKLKVSEGFTFKALAALSISPLLWYFPFLSYMPDLSWSLSSSESKEFSLARTKKFFLVGTHTGFAMGVGQDTGEIFEGSLTGLLAGILGGDEGLPAGILGGDLSFTGLPTGLVTGLPTGILGGDEGLPAGILGGDLTRVGSFLIGLNDGLGTVGSDPVGVLIVGGTDGRSVGARGAEVGAGGDKGVAETAAGKSAVVGVGLQALVGFAVGVPHVVVVCSWVINEFVAEIDVHKAAIRTGRRVLIFRAEW